MTNYWYGQAHIVLSFLTRVSHSSARSIIKDRLIKSVHLIPPYDFQSAQRPLIEIIWLYKRKRKRENKQICVVFYHIIWWRNVVVSGSSLWWFFNSNWWKDHKLGSDCGFYLHITFCNHLSSTDRALKVWCVCLRVEQKQAWLYNKIACIIVPEATFYFFLSFYHLE